MTVILKTSPLKIFLRTRILCSDDKIINFLLQKTFLIIAFVAFEYKYKKKEERTLRKANLSVVEVVLLNLVGVAAVFSFGIRELFISSPPRRDEWIVFVFANFSREFMFVVSSSKSVSQ